MKSYQVHLQNKYPGARVERSESSVKCYAQDGELLCVVEKDGQGNWGCAQKEHGARDAWSLDPLPKNARAMKLHVDGSVGRAEEFAERKVVAQALASKFGGRVPSISECKSAGLTVAADGSVAIPQA